MIREARNFVYRSLKETEPRLAALPITSPIKAKAKYDEAVRLGFITEGEAPMINKQKIDEVMKSQPTA